MMDHDSEKPAGDAAERDMIEGVATLASFPGEIERLFETLIASAAESQMNVTVTVSIYPRDPEPADAA